MASLHSNETPGSRAAGTEALLGRRYDPKMNAWQPGVFRRFPWAGLGCLFGVLCSIVVDTTILAVSNGKPISTWKYPPSLYLSVAYTIGNILLSAAFSQGLTVRTNVYSAGARLSHS